MKRYAILAVLLVATSAGSGRAGAGDCDAPTDTKSVIAVYSNQHDTAAPQSFAWDIYLLDPTVRDANGMLTVWKHFPGRDADFAAAVSPRPQGAGRLRQQPQPAGGRTSLGLLKQSSSSKLTRASRSSCIFLTLLRICR